MKMTGKQQQIEQLLQRTIKHFNKKEQFLIKNNLCERCICARFAMYLERVLSRSVFRDYTTDVEYDRGMGGNDYGKKRVFGHDAYLDLIVHKRGYDESMGYDNLFAVEFKWQGNDFNQDTKRLMALVDNENGFMYRAGFAIRIISSHADSFYGLTIEECYYNQQDF